jgi:hypothetical protein
MLIAAHGLGLQVPTGWEGRIRRQALPPGTSPQFRSHAVLHAGDFALPDERGDFGSGAVEALRPNQAFFALVEYGTGSVGTALFASSGMPGELRTDEFSSRQLQRTLPGQGGVQRFFVEEGRAFCLYVVLGSMAERSRVVPKVNAVLATVTIAAAAPPELLEQL